jgi:hypothetical protein
MACADGKGGGAGVASVVTRVSPTTWNVDNDMDDIQLAGLGGGGDPKVGCGVGNAASEVAAASIHNPSRFQP